MLWLPRRQKLSPNYELLAANFTPSKESLAALEAEVDGAPDEEIARFPRSRTLWWCPTLSAGGERPHWRRASRSGCADPVGVRSESLEVAIGKQLDPEKQGYLHFIYEPAGPMTTTSHCGTWWL
jgi:hypothetical protein